MIESVMNTVWFWAVLTVISVLGLCLSLLSESGAGWIVLNTGNILWSVFWMGYEVRRKVAR